MTQDTTKGTPEKTIYSVDFDRLQRDIEELSQIGRSEDGGLYRMAFTDADMEARQWLIKRLEEAGFEARMDEAANVLGRSPGTSDEVRTVLTGSHIDTVPNAGSLDGALGVLVSLECMRRVREEGLDLKYPLELVAFSDEEGRFGGLFGSSALCGELTPERIESAQDLDGVPLTQVMQRHGLEPLAALRARRNPASLRCYLELHIEQGPVLDAEGLTAGVVEEIVGLFKWSVRLIGRPDHAGTTPMDMRRDAFNGLAEFAHEIKRVLEENGSDDSVATVGKVDLSPGTANTVPGSVEFSLDVRDPDEEVLEDLGAAFRRVLSALGRRRNLMFEFDVLSQIQPMDCNRKIVEVISRTADEMGIASRQMPSGAAHDAQIMAKMAPVGMIFVPSKDGRSHSPAEWTHWEDIESGANLMLNSLICIAGGEAEDE
ncbi:MAG TPA: Zn-dependent hydrolase [Acidobacteriota bacterium]|nr:Zn-dependent hydrolase [Acidobacteriota bacterium]